MCVGQYTRNIRVDVCGPIAVFFSVESMSKKKAVEEVVDIPAHVEPEVSSGSGCFVYQDGSKYDGEYRVVGGVKFRDGQGSFTYGPEEYTGVWKNDAMKKCK